MSCARDGPARTIGCATAIRQSLSASAPGLIRDGIAGTAAHHDPMRSTPQPAKAPEVGSDLQFAERGVHELKGARGKWGVFGVAQDRLRATNRPACHPEAIRMHHRHRGQRPCRRGRTG
jgi:hypothetical protein